jgi:hypothetical protein
MTASKQGSGLDRRDFLKGFASATVAAGLVGPGEVLAAAKGGPPGVPPGQFGRNLLPPPTISGPQSGEAYWAKVRKTFSLPDDYIHMNTGTTGSPPQFVVNNLAVYNRYKAEDPLSWGANLAADFPTLFPTSPSATGARQAMVAAVYGANADEIVLSYNTTDACNLIFAGTPWQPGDRIVTTSFEHPALAGPIAWARDTFGVEVVIVDIPSNFTADITVADVLGWFDRHCRHRCPWVREAVPCRLGYLLQERPAPADRGAGAHWPALTVPIRSSIRPTVGGCCPSTVTPTAPISSPGPDTNGSAAARAQVSSMSAIREKTCRRSRWAISSPTAIHSSPPAPTSRIATGIRLPDAVPRRKQHPRALCDDRLARLFHAARLGRPSTSAGSTSATI